MFVELRNWTEHFSKVLSSYKRNNARKSRKQPKAHSSGKRCRRVFTSMTLGQSPETSQNKRYIKNINEGESRMHLDLSPLPATSRNLHTKCLSHCHHLFWKTLLFCPTYKNLNLLRLKNWIAANNK